MVAVDRRILENLVLAMPPGGGEEKKARGKKKDQTKKKADPKKVEILDACAALGKACNKVRDMDGARRYSKRAKEEYEEQLFPDDAKTLDVTRSLIMATKISRGEKIEKLRDLVRRCERALGEENVVTLETLNSLGDRLMMNGEFVEAIKVHERCLAGRMKVFGENHKDTLGSLNNLGGVYHMLKNYEKSLEHYERALKGY
ncbi:hypothetical protein TL16_g06092 [Triparma laevis f. inornata]|uniref:Kinesin light chain n=1 Tax=Triparma laevis f. inornata TaxID=1714386 RepID=A0A9W7APF9_9STRA|nr:hypothetical protein TL16_g06092 [Triparma laevis f. inornata]